MEYTNELEQKAVVSYGTGWSHRSGDDCPVNHYELGMQTDFENRCQDMAIRIAMLESEKYSDHKDIEVYKQLKSEMNKLEDKIDCRLDKCEHALHQQSIYNATNTGMVATLEHQVHELMRLTRRIIPNESVVPGWDDTTEA